MSRARYIISSPDNDWAAFEIEVDKGLVVSRSKGADVTIGADFNALKKHLWNDGKRYRVTEVKESK